MRAPASNSLWRLVAPGVAMTMTLALSACFTGDRPTLAQSVTETGDPAADAVLARLGAVRDATFTARYRILTRFGGATARATVTQTRPARRAVTIGRTRFIIEGPRTATCDLDDGECSATIDAQQVSNLQVTPDFYGSSAAARLRRDTSLRAGPTRASTETIAGQPATCVVVPVTGGESTYCALDSGPLARIDAADVSIELNSFSPQPDERQFERPD